MILSTWQLMHATGATRPDVERFAGSLLRSMDEFDIATPRRVAMFLAQVGHESGGLRYLREIWGPTKAQAGYEGRRDLGNTEPGDGFRFRGRGLIQITGRANYAAAGRALGVDLLAEPEMLEQPGLAARSAAWWWAAHGLNELADTGDVRACTRRINGGLNGIDDREDRFRAACDAIVGCMR